MPTIDEFKDVVETEAKKKITVPVWVVVAVGVVSFVLGAILF